MHFFKKIFLVLSILILAGCNSNPNEWTDEAQTQFRLDCQKLNSVSENYCECVLQKLMLEYNETDFNLESENLLKNNLSNQILNSINIISKSCNIE